ncbi:MAG: peptide chain release factor N(5)-glutamine methyltransferase [Pseudomonadales bacterium]
MANSVQVRDALSNAQAILKTDSNVLESQLLLGHVLSKPRSWLLAHDDEILDIDSLRELAKLVDQRRAGVPIAYLLGYQEFWSLELKVTPATLIPRPDTESLVEALLVKSHGKSQTILDLGTGSGAIALALAKERPMDIVFGMDKSIAAIKVAKYNQTKHQLNNVQFFVGNWCTAIADQSIDVLVSNPPYVADHDPHLDELKFEPLSALTAGADGLKDIRQLCATAARCLKPGGTLAVEHGFDQQSAVMDIFTQHHFVRVSGFPDLQGNDRFVMGTVQ